MPNKMLMFAFLIAATIFGSSSSQAQQLLESYVALLSERDHFNSDGQRLTSAAAIIRQDRANFHRFGLRDPADEDDRFFVDEGNRAALENLLAHGRADQGVINRIVNGTPLVRVEVWKENAGPFIVVTLIDLPTTGGANPQETNAPPANFYYYVANTRPPDAFLALRTEPSASLGQRIMAMANGTMLQVLQRRGDGWWYVKVVPTGQDGWAFSGQGNQAFIVCCTMAGAFPEGPSAQQQLNQFSCDQLWYARNSIFTAAGFCFKTPRAISAFGNAGCLYDNEDDIPLSQKDRNTIQAIQGAERNQQCPR